MCDVLTIYNLYLLLLLHNTQKTSCKIKDKEYFTSLRFSAFKNLQMENCKEM